MKKLITYSALALSSLMMMPSCTGNFEDFNTPPYGVTDDELTQDNNYIGMHFPNIQKSIYWNATGGNWEFQLIQNLHADVWSGYMASASNFKGGLNTQTYVVDNGWSDYAWNYPYDYVMTNQLKVYEKCEEMGLDTYGHFNAINTILRIFAMSDVCDQYGPIIYSHYGESKTGGTYDSAQDAYKKFFEELTEASKVLMEYSAKECASFAKFDMSPYKGDLSRWARVANTLHLRLAMRVVKYDAAWAQKEAEAAIAAPGGLLQPGDRLEMSGYGWKNPLYAISIGWGGDVLVSANVKSILGGYGDPRLAKMGIADAKGNVMGVRMGIPDLDKNGDAYKKLVSRINVGEETPAPVMSAAEAYFLLAEAALRGWEAGGSAKDFYEKGVSTSFDEFGVSMGDYLNSSKVPADWVDPLVAAYNEKAASTITPKWDDATSDEERLEKIITQKWIAGFPEGKNAWSEYRRTGYPAQFKVLKNDSQGVISTEEGVRRLPFTLEEKTNNPEGYAKAVEMLGGPDTPATRVFWDVKKGNF